MIKTFGNLSRYFLFWVGVFFTFRLSFVLWNWKKFQSVDTSEIALSFIHGLSMDFSMAGYFTALPALVMMVCWFIPSIQFPRKALAGYSLTLLLISNLINIFDINLYTEWNSKLTFNAVKMLFTQTKVVLASSASAPLFSLILVFCALLLLQGWAYYRDFYKRDITFKRIAVGAQLFSSVLFLGLIFLAIRGSLSVAPMNTSNVYFSNKPLLNHAAINTNWVLVAEYLKRNKTENAYIYYDKSALSVNMQQLFPEQQAADKHILRVEKPNIVFVIMESFTADVVEALGGEKDITPAFAELLPEGLLFNRFYASGDRTDKGLVALLSAFPTQANKSIILENAKQEKLPGIALSLKDAGYHTSFYYGGDIKFSNFKAFLLSHGIDALIDIESFPLQARTSKWGAYDHQVFDKQLQYLKTNPAAPFFSVILTSSNHEPFDLPDKGRFGAATVQDQFRSTNDYATQSFKHYLREAQKLPSYANTLFVVVADHGHRLPKEKFDSFESGRYHIPLLLLGGALKTEYKNKQITKVGAQTDLAATLLNQLGLSYKDFPYSNDLLNDSPGFAFYSWGSGFGMVDAQGEVAFDAIRKEKIALPPDTPSNPNRLRDAKAIMQSVFSDYLNP